jgi:hypothetical protein
MKPRFIQWMLLAAIGLMLATFATEAAAQTQFNMRFRANWRALYTDHNFGDYFKSGTGLPANMQAGYLVYDIYTGSGSTWVGGGILDANGYSDYVSATNGQTYWLRIATVLKGSDGRKIYMQPVSATTSYNYGPYFQYYYYTIHPSGYAAGSSQTFTGNFEVGYHARVGPVARNVMAFPNTLNYEANRVLYVAAAKGSGCKYDFNDHLFFSHDISLGTGCDSYKFMTAHEFGHAMGDNGASGVITCGFEFGAFDVHDTNPDCHCDNFDGTDWSPASHCVTSRETFGAAQSEGFGNFAAAVLLNDRNAAEGEFAYWRGYNLPAGIPGVPAGNTGSPWSVSMVTRPRYMENKCNSAMVDNGVEWDWQNFFWQVWTSAGTNRVEISELLSIWKQPSTAPWYMHDWETIRSRAETKWGTNSAKYTNFRDTGVYNGINH